ncbi:hypothetical protein F4860DRAFT_232487 [Xylaria cubensis]|nr:hypothetical protein F4860DRAFT_232487 [Xylaria cubensis]
MEEFRHNGDGKVISTRQYVEGEAGGNRVCLLSFDLSFDLRLKRLDIRHDGADIYRMWSDRVATYSQRSLTRPETDKLIGLVGIACEFGRALVHKLSLIEAKSRIWVGDLWLADIFQSQLCEQVGHLPALAPRPSLDWYDARRINEILSWSWASRRCLVSRCCGSAII